MKEILRNLEHNKAFFIGCFPPPYGGATIKNLVLYKELSTKFDLSVFDTTMLNKGLVSYVKLIKFLLKNKNLPGFICIGSISLFKITTILRKISKNLLNNISVFVLGGIFDKLLIEHKQNIEIYNSYKNIYVGSNILKIDLERFGLKNIRVLPNLRPIPNKKYTSSKGSDKPIKCVFLSSICKDKGIFKILEAANLLSKENIDYIIDFYGPIDKSIEEKFLNEVLQNKRLNYMGVIKSFGEEIYQTLDKYDVLLFPSEHSGEGMPGIIVEARIAGLPVIASKWKYSHELISDGKDGIILKSNDASKLKEAIKDLYCDRVKLNDMAKNSSLLSENYYVENKVNEIINRM